MVAQKKMLGGGGGLPMVLSHLMNVGSVVGALRGGRGTHTLPAVIELVLTFCTLRRYG